MDFVVRDLFLTGTVNIQLDFDGLIAAANRSHNDWRLLLNLDHYLVETNYCSKEVETVRSLFVRALADHLMRERISLEDLFGLPGAKLASDAQVESVLKKTKAGREIFDPDRRRNWKAWYLNADIEDSDSQVSIEKIVAADKPTYLVSPFKSRAFCYKPTKANTLAVALSHDGKSDRPKLSHLIEIFQNLASRQKPTLHVESFVNALWEAVSGFSISHGLYNRLEFIAECDEENPSVVPPEVKKMAARVHTNGLRAQMKKAEEPAFVSLRIGGLDYPLEANRTLLSLHLMHSALSGEKSNRDRLGIPYRRLVEILWNAMLEWQTDYFGERMRPTVSRFLNRYLTALRARIESGSSTAEQDIEAYAFLKSLSYPQDVQFRVTLPNLTFFDPEHRPTNEFDSVSLVLTSAGEVEVWLWGATAVSKDFHKKRTDDVTKMGKFGDILAARWGREVKVVQNYVWMSSRKVHTWIEGVTTSDDG